MKRILLALAAASALTVTAARADHVDFRGGFSINTPGYDRPDYAPRGDGYWREANVNVWVPPHWEVTSNYWGQRINVWQPGHYEVRTQRVWVDAYAARRNHERWEHERWEHERREREHGRDRDDDRWNR